MIKKFYGACAIFLFWYLMYFFLNTSAIPNPFSTIVYSFNSFPILMPHLLMSFIRISIALVLSALIGTLIGIFMARNQLVDDLLAPIVYILYPIPKIAFLPILMLLFGLNETPKILLVISVIVFQFIMSIKDAVKDIDFAYFDSAKSLNLSGFQTYKHIIVPAILPSFFTALRISVGISMAVLFFGENFSTHLGIGYFIMNSYAMVNYMGMYAGILALSLMGLMIFSALDFVEVKLCPWNEKESL